MSKRILLLCIAGASILAAQDPPTRAGRLSYKTGAVSFQPGGVNDWVDAPVNRPLTVGDQIFADQGARAEIQVPGSSFRLGSRTAFEFLNLDDRNVQVRLSEGSLIVSVRELYGENMEIDTPNAAMSITSPGEYRIDAEPDANETYLTARAGQAQIIANNGSFTLYQRQQAVVNGQDQAAQYQVYAAPGYDEFDNWAMSRDRRDDRRVSSRYVPSSVVGYEDLDDYGNWQNVPEYGDVWVPRGVPAGWAPYRDGHWAWIDPWGWTWVDDQPWGFAPFHYGRWAHFRNTWGWVPCPRRQMPVYAPALVAWIGSDAGFSFSASFGGGPSVGWFPLGPRDVYIPAYRATPQYVNRVNTTNTTVINNVNITNIYNNYVRTGSVPISSYAYHRVPNAITAVPQSALTSARPVQQVVMRVDPNRAQQIRTAVAAPRVAPQTASVLGRPTTSAMNAPRPAAAVMSRPVVARSTPPRPSSFSERQPLLARNPGQPLPIQQQRQMAPATQAPVRVITHAPTVTPVVRNAAAPRPGQVAAQSQTTTPQRPGEPIQPRTAQSVPAQPPTRAQAQPARPAEPPSAQRPPQPQPLPQASRRNAPNQPERQAQPPVRAQEQPRPFEPPSPQRQPQQMPQASRPNAPNQPERQAQPPVRELPSAQRQPQPMPQGSRANAPNQPERQAPVRAHEQPRSFEPPSAQRQPQQMPQAPRPNAPNQPERQAPVRAHEQPRSLESPAAQRQPQTPRQSAPNPPHTQAQPPVRVEPRSVEPPAAQRPAQQRAPQAAARPQQNEGHRSRVEPQPAPVRPQAQPPQRQATPPPAARAEPPARPAPPANGRTQPAEKKQDRSQEQERR
jgi:hypothetical protein